MASLPGRNDSANTNNTSGVRKNEQHVCHICDKRFTRAEHVQRHVLAHENKKPFKCRICGSRYGRADVLGRHLKKCGAGSRTRHPNARKVSNAPAVMEIAEATIHSEGSPAEPAEPQSSGTVAPLTSQNMMNYIAADMLQVHGPLSPPRSLQSSRQTQSRRDSCLIDPILSADQPVSFSMQSQTQPNQEMGTDMSMLPVMRASPPYSLNTGSAAATASNITTSQQHGPSPNQGLLQDVGFMSGVTGHVNNDTEMDSTFFSSMFLEEALLPDLSLPAVIDDAFFDFGSVYQTVDRQSEINTTADRELREAGRAAGTQPTPPTRDDGPSRDKDQNTSRAEGGGGRYSLRITTEDINTLEGNIMAADIFNMIEDFKMPTTASVLRSINAYISYFDPHTPIIHWPSFSVWESHPALILAMIAIGARHLSEYDSASRAYDAAVVLLAQHEVDASWCHEEQLSLWPVQATLLCAQFGAFSDNKARARRAHYQLGFASTMLRHGHEAVTKLKMMPTVDWSTWVYLQTYSRLAAWATILFSVVLAYDSTMSCIIPSQAFDLPMPTERESWCARSSQEWKQLGGEDAAVKEAEIGLFTAVKMLLQAEVIPVRLTSFGLLTTVGAILSYICSHERLSSGLGEVFRSDFTIRMEQSLAIWEQLWRSHPLAEQTPSKLGDPLMSDCFSLLGSARYHLYVGKQLVSLKSLAVDPQSLFHPLQFQPSADQPGADVCKAVRYAAHSWLVRVKIGLAHLERTAALEFGGHTLVTGYEGALLLSWWLSLDANQRRSYHEVMGPREQTLDDLFDEIFQYLGEQDPTFADSPRCRAPLLFYNRLMRGAFWTYGLTMAENLDRFSQRQRYI